MKTSTIAAVVAVFFLVIGSGVAAALVVQSSMAETIAAINARDEAAAGTLQALRDEIASMRRDMSELKAEPGKIYVASRPAAAGGDGKVDLEYAESPENAPINEAAKSAPRAATGTVDAGATEVVKEAVKQALKEQRKSDEDTQKKEQEAKIAEFKENMKTSLEEEVVNRGDMYMKELNLTPVQEGQVQTALEERKTAMLAAVSLLGEGGGAPGGPPPKIIVHKKLMEAEKKFQEDMASILTKDQLAIYMEKNLSGMNSGGGPGGGNPGGGGMNPGGGGMNPGGGPGGGNPGGGGPGSGGPGGGGPGGGR